MSYRGERVLLFLAEMEFVWKQPVWSSHLTQKTFISSGPEIIIDYRLLTACLTVSAMSLSL
jgi:hypothetical protein